MAMHSRHTGSREMFSSGDPQRRQSEGNSAANKPWAMVAVPETARCSSLRPWGTAVRVVSPLLLKTSLPHPAPGQAPAGRIHLSISGRRFAGNDSGGCVTVRSKFRFSRPCRQKYRGVGPAETVRASHRLEQQQRKNVLFQNRAPAGTVSCRSTAIGTLIIASEHD